MGFNSSGSEPPRYFENTCFVGDLPDDPHYIKHCVLKIVLSLNKIRHSRSYECKKALTNGTDYFKYNKFLQKKLVLANAKCSQADY